MRGRGRVRARVTAHGLGPVGSSTCCLWKPKTFQSKQRCASKT